MRQDHPNNTLSLIPAQREKDSLGLLSDYDYSVSCKYVGTDSVLSLSEARKANQFCQYLSDTPKQLQHNFAHFNGEDAGLKQSRKWAFVLIKLKLTLDLKYGFVNIQKDYLLSEMNIDLFSST